MTTVYRNLNFRFGGFFFYFRMRRRCVEGCSSGSSMPQDDGGFGHEGVYAMTTYNIHSGYGHTTGSAGSQSMESTMISGSIGRGGSLGRGSMGGNRGSIASVGKPSSSTLASLAGLLSSSDTCKEGFYKQRDEIQIQQQQQVQQQQVQQQQQDNREEKEPVLQRVRVGFYLFSYLKPSFFESIFFVFKVRLMLEFRSC